MPAKRKTKKLKQQKRLSPLKFVIAFAVVAFATGLWQFVFAASTTRVSGRVYTTAGKGIANVKLDLCHGKTAKTGSDGRWSYNMSSATIPDSGFCVRIAGGIPSGYKGPTTFNRPDHAGYGAYEWQYAGYNCYKNYANCPSQGQDLTWDLGDSGFNFVYKAPKTSTPKPPSDPNPEPTPTPTPSSSPTSTPTSSKPKPDKTDPTAPSGLKLSRSETNTFIVLSWKASKDNKGVKGYRVERSEGDDNWTVLTKSTQARKYNDSTIDPTKSYQYRVIAFDAAGNKSKATESELSKPANFIPNFQPGTDSQVISTDGAMLVTLPGGAIPQAAMCVLQPREDLLVPLDEGQSVVGTAQELSCRLADGTLFTEFTVPLKLSVVVGAHAPEVKSAILLRQENDQWQNAATSKLGSSDEATNFELQKAGVLGVVTSEKKNNPWPKVILTILLIIGFMLGLLYAIAKLRLMMQRRKLEAKQDEFYRKSKGL